MAEPAWLTVDEIVELHDWVIAETGGMAGLRDAGLLVSALNRPPNRFAYEDETDLAVLAATYAAAISANHPFADGNKRAAFLALGLFLDLNGMTLAADQTDATARMLELASGELGVAELSEWVRARMRPHETDKG